MADQRPGGFAPVRDCRGCKVQESVASGTTICALIGNCTMPDRARGKSDEYIMAVASSVRAPRSREEEGAADRERDLERLFRG